MGNAQSFGSNQSTFELQPFDRLTLAVVGTGVIFASLGLGEAVYRLLFLEFDGATDRFPLEMLSGLTFAWIVTKLARRIYQRRREANARLKLIRDRNHKIRHALGAIVPVSLPGHQQAIRVIREEVESIDLALSDILPRQPEKQTLSERFTPFQ
jgi:hypothetical protein